ncbi:T-complex protein 11-domain-containing protein [Stachybotrys elegans]|uniref:T-complex protein 11-domain-containing protein n=1 Tax=Stachybotrys elegans TaxID=80388 RepID=A0A8K0SVB4_9HYPO|nr:T-complex protein 11-domain-containing protein [Stachybotrys elegans]
MRRSSVDLSDPSRNLEESDGAPSDETVDMDLDLAMPPSEDEVLEQTTRIFTPPPRVAARFYRPSQARRKDSAASSRRNSMSSAHSRCSSVQPLGREDDGTQSKHVAQHLRRASFLADRRARLADRAAHAEKVRLRAALAKAAPRGSSASEERALAAQQARERNLAEIVANCAEEVKKAKQVAEFMKEKREQDIAKMKAQMEGRMAEAERRREEFRSKNIRRGRGQSVAAKRAAGSTSPAKERTPSPPLTDEAAVARIQGWWRGRSRRLTVQDFNNLGLTVDGIRDTSFDTVVALLAQDKVLLTTARLLRICGLEEGETGSVTEMAAVRTFLSAYLILGHPNQVLSNKTEGEMEEKVEEPHDPLRVHRLPSADLENPQLQDLVGKAKDLLIAFENILARLTTANRHTMPPALKKTLPEAYAVFHNAFIAWKSRDSNALIEVMLMQFVELDAIFQTVKDTSDNAATGLYRQSIQDSQLMLIVRIKKLAGQERGRKLIFDAVSEARKSRKAKKKTGDMKPRVAETAAEETTPSASSSAAPETQTLTPPSTPAGKSQPRDKAPKSPLDRLLPDNRIIVHELAINEEYQISSDEYKELVLASTKPMYDYMRTMKDGTEDNFRFFKFLAGFMRDKLQKLLSPGSPMFNLIGEILDPDIAERQFTLGNFSFEKFFAAMGSLLPRLCAPFRDPEVKDLIQNKLQDGNLVDRIMALNGFIDVMISDYINYLLKLAAPQLIASSAQYEAKRFTQDIEQGGMSLSVAEAMWRSSRAKVMAEVQKRDPEGINHPKSRPTASKFYAQMLVDIFTQPTPVKEEQVPEMLRLDLKRINQVSTMVQRIITAGAVLLQCKNLLKRDVRSPWKTEAARVLSVLEANHASVETTVDGVMAALESGRSMPGATKTHLRALVRKVVVASQDMFVRSTEPREPVLRLLLTRIRSNILVRLSAGSAGEKVRAANTAGEKLASLGLSEFVEKVRLIADLLDKVGAVDKEAHGPWWDAIATKVEQEQEQ